MPDLFDQISDAQAEVQKNQPAKPRTTGVFTFVFYLNGEWHDATYLGTLSDCSEALEEAVAQHGGDLDKIRWARGHKEGKNIAIHPKNDPEAESEIRRVLALNPEPQVIPAIG